MKTYRTIKQCVDAARYANHRAVIWKPNDTVPSPYDIWIAEREAHMKQAWRLKAKDVISNLCPICEDGAIIDFVEANEMTYKGVTSYIGLHMSACEICMSYFSNDKQSKINKDLVAEFHKSVDRTHPGN